MPTSRGMMLTVKARALVALGRKGEAGMVFEAAAEEAHRHGLFLFAAFALRDLKVLLLDEMGHGDHGSRRLGAALRQLIGPADLLTPLLGGLDAAELIRLPPPDASYTVVYSTEDPVQAALRHELEGLRLKELRNKAKELGMSEDTVEDALDADDPKAAVIVLILNASQVAEDAASQFAQHEVALLSELQGLRLKELRKRARDADIDGELLDDATDADDPKAAVIALLMAQCKLPDVDDGEAALRTELQGLLPKELRGRAKAAGIDADDLDDAVDSDDPKAALIQLLLAHGSSSPAAEGDRPHFGTKQPQSAAKAKRTSRKGLLPADKHAMISYQWDDQERVIAARETLNHMGVPCWMDIDGGMQQDIYESMAAGVENAACVVCFMSQKYQESVSASHSPPHLISMDVSERLLVTAGEL